jgi:hypothetical protein
MEQQNYIAAAVDTAIFYHQDLSNHINLKYTITQTSRIHYKIDFEWSVGYDTHTLEQIEETDFIMWTYGKEEDAFIHIDNLLDELEKVNYDEDYNSKLAKLEDEGQSQLDSFRNK